MKVKYGEEWTAQPGDLPDAVDLALALEIGIVGTAAETGAAGSKAGSPTRSCTQPDATGRSSPGTGAGES